MEVPEPEEEHKKKKKKSKEKKTGEEKIKKSKGKKKKSASLEEESPLSGHSKEGYEQPQGISTPSKEVFLSSPGTSVPSILPLGSNRDVAVEYLVRPSIGLDPASPSLSILLILHNRSAATLKHLDVNLSASAAYSLSGPGRADSGRRLLAELLPGSRQESNLDLEFSETAMSHKIRGTLSYISQNKDGSTEDKLDFWLMIPVTAFIYPAQLSGSLSFTELLSSGSLEYRHSDSIPVPPHINFTQVLDQICAGCHLGVMEKIDGAASLYGRCGPSGHICVLLKQSGAAVSVELKTTCQGLGPHLMQEMAAALESLAS